MNAISIDRFKRQAKILRKFIQSQPQPARVPSLAKSQERIARWWGFADWHELNSIFTEKDMTRDRRIDRVKRILSQDMQQVDDAWRDEFVRRVIDEVKEEYLPSAHTDELVKIVDRILGTTRKSAMSAEFPWDVVVDGKTQWDLWTADQRYKYLDGPGRASGDWLERLTQLAEEPFPVAMVTLSYLSGFDVVVPTPNGLRWMTAAADLDDPDAAGAMADYEDVQARRALLAQGGSGEIPLSARRLRAAELGHLGSMFHVAESYYYGDKDRQAFALAKRGCDLGDAHLCNLQGAMLAQGIGVKRNPRRAIDVYMQIPSKQYARLRTSVDEFRWFVEPGTEGGYNEDIAEELFGEDGDDVKTYLHAKLSEHRIKRSTASENTRLLKGGARMKLVSAELTLRHPTAIEHFCIAGDILFNRVEKLYEVVQQVEYSVAESVVADAFASIEQLNSDFNKQGYNHEGWIDGDPPDTPEPGGALSVSRWVPTEMHAAAIELFGAYDRLLCAVDGLSHIEFPDQLPGDDDRQQIMTRAFGSISALSRHLERLIEETSERNASATRTTNNTDQHIQEASHEHA